jgi:hypothetical protein
MKRSTLALRLLGSSMLLALGTGAQAAPASGTVKMHGTSWTVADAMAYAEDDETHVVLGSAVFDRKSYAEDGKLDDFDFMRQDGLKTITLKVKADGTMSCMDFSTGSGGGSSCGSVGGGLKLTEQTPKSIAGTFKMKDDDDTADVQFKVAIESKTLARSGTPLPAGGGDAGKALLAAIAAVQSGDLKKIKAVSPPDRVAAIEASEKSGDAKDMVEMMKLMTPTITKITGGIAEGDTATLDWTGTDGGQAAKGTAKMKRVNGQWYMAGISSGN